jgi:hypothetical protein
VEEKNMAREGINEDASPESTGGERSKGADAPHGRRRPPRLRLPLRTIPDVAKQMAVVFREARAGRLDVSDASKLTNCLALLSRTLEGSDLANRLDALEAQANRGGR